MAKKYPTGLTRRDVKRTRELGLPQAAVPGAKPPDQDVTVYGEAFGWKYNNMVPAMRHAEFKLEQWGYPLQVLALQPSDRRVFAQAKEAMARRNLTLEAVRNRTMTASTDSESTGGTVRDGEQEVIGNQSEPEPGEIEGLSIAWLAKQTGWNAERLEAIIASLEDDSPQVILSGPPGTGKTWVAKHLARYLTNDVSRATRIVQFHPSYGYEEFVEGLRPVIEDGAVQFKRQDGVILKMARETAESGEVRVLIIDEMNRANLPRVFGELMYLLEYREDSLDLMYSEAFVLPRKLLFIGTMNTADRSIRTIDLALRRRFDIFECLPERAILEQFYEEHENEVPSLLNGFEALNGDLEGQLGKHYLVGHTYFMCSPMTLSKLHSIWELQIRPLIEDFFFDQPDVASEFTLQKYFG